MQNGSINALEGTGTSFAAPLVTGIAAQLHQASPYLKTNPMATKAIILAGSDPTAISTQGNAATESTYVRKKSGAGLVNAINSINIADSYHSVSVTFNLGTDSYLKEYVDAFTVPAGKTARVVMTFNKPDALGIPSTGYRNDVNFSIHDNTTEEIITSSNSNYNNVEIIQFTISSEKSKNFYINVSLTSRTSNSSTTNVKVGIAYRYI